MNKQKVNWLISFMIIAMLGIITMQVVWMQRSIKVRNELFNRGVNEALIRSSERLETLSDVLFLDDMVGIDKFNRHRFNARPHSRRMPPRPRFQPNDSLRNFNIKRKMEVIVNSHPPKEMNVEAFRIDSIIDSIHYNIDQSFTVLINDSISRPGNDSIKQIKIRASQKSQRLKKLASRMVFEDFRNKHNNFYNSERVESIINDELSRRDIPIPFEFGINQDSILRVKSENADSILLLNSPYHVKLNPNEIFNSNNILMINFPNRKHYILSSLILPISLSLLFSTFIMLAFILSIHYILKQKKISEMKSDFINNMTHEFKTPLATISVATDTMVNPKIINRPDQIKHFAQIIKEQNLKMNDQVENILQIAQVEQKNLQLKIELFNIHALLMQATETIKLQVENRAGSIQLNLDAQNPIISTDKQHILSVFDNILDNANKYSDKSPEITISTTNIENGIWISIQDKGIGMNKQDQDKIFEKFFRATSGNIHNVKGFGLGLSYSKAIIEANKGSIKVTSTPEKGSTFEIFLPFTI